MQLDDPEAARAFRSYREEHRQLRDTASTDPEDEKRIKADARHFDTTAQRFQHLDKYARWDEEKGRRETFEESVDRVITFLKRYVDSHAAGALIPGDTWRQLRDAIIAGEACTSMRVMQMAGPALDRCVTGAYNCTFCGISDLDYLHEMLYLLMQGCGCGFSVENEFVAELPRIRRPRGGRPDNFIVPDTTEGWCESLKFGLERWFDGGDVAFDYSHIRPEGAKLKTKGGTASGPKPLQHLHNFTRKVILSQQKSRLRDIDVHDICCYIGRAGQLGGVRRAAEISLSDLGSKDMASAKHGDWLRSTVHRTMANNSAVYEVKPDAVTFMREWLSLAENKSGERGIFNREGISRVIPERRRKLYGRQQVAWGCNPCGEIILHPDGQMCNLSIAIVRPDDSEEDLLRKVGFAAIFGTIQSLMTDFKYVRDRWRENCERERLLGVDLLGAFDNPLLRPDNPDLPNLLERLKRKAIDTNVRWAGILGINPSSAVTCIKPGGNSSVRWNTGQSMSGWMSKYLIRKVEVAKRNPMYRFLKDSGVPYEDSYRDSSTAVFSFPMAAPEGARVVSDLVVGPDGRATGIKPRDGAIAQLEAWKLYKQHYTEHNPSVSIYVADDEWLAVGNWVYANWDIVGGLSFYPLDSGIYDQAPITPVTEEEYKRVVADFPDIPWEKLPRYEFDDHTDQRGERACGGKDGCLI